VELASCCCSGTSNLEVALDLGKICSVLLVILFCHLPKTVSKVCRHFCWIVFLENGVCLGSRD
jgi:hypothetical protein